MVQYVEVIFQDLEEKKEYEELAKKVLRKCFEVENINPNLFYISVTLTDAKHIQEINNQFRQVNKPTDVLSFPMFEKEELDLITQVESTPNEKCLQEVLGDIIISIPKVHEQANEYGHSFERELSYMLVHGFYHLRGYDHIEEEEKKVMREKEEIVLNQLQITR